MLRVEQEESGQSTVCKHYINSMVFNYILSLPQGIFGNIWSYFWVNSIWWVKVRHTSKHATIHRTAPPQQRIIWSKVSSSEVEKPWLKCKRTNYLYKFDLSHRVRLKISVLQGTKNWPFTEFAGSFTNNCIYSWIPSPAKSHCCSPGELSPKHYLISHGWRNVSVVGGLFLTISSTPKTLKLSKKNFKSGQPQWLSGLAPPSAQDVILETQDRVPCQALCVELASPSACVSEPLSLCVSHE